MDRIERLLNQAERQVSQHHVTVEVLTDDIFILNDYINQLTSERDIWKRKHKSLEKKYGKMVEHNTAQRQ